MIGCFPGASVNPKLKVIIVAAAVNLPGSAQVGTLALITDLTVGHTYASALAPSSPVVGDVWVWVGGESLAPVALGNYITVYPRAVYQYTGSWILREAYVYSGSSWINISLLTYLNGIFYFNNSFSITAQREGKALLTLGANAIQYRLEADVNGSAWAWAFTTLPVDLSNVSTIKLDFATSGSYMSGSLSVATSRDASGNVATTALAHGEVTKNLDVSALTGLHYIGVYFNSTVTSAAGYGYVSRLERIA